MIIAEKITMLRKKNMWSQEELADKLGVSRQSVSKWESAQSVPDLDKILKLSELFEVSTDYLLKDNTEVEKKAEVKAEEKKTDGIRRVNIEEANAYLACADRVANLKSLGIASCLFAPIVLILLRGIEKNGSGLITKPIASGIGIIFSVLFIGFALSLFFFCHLQSKRYEYLSRFPFETEYGVMGILDKKISEYRVVHMILNFVGLRICVTSLLPYIIVTMLDMNSIIKAAFLCYALVSVALGVYFFVTSNTKWAALMLLKEENGMLYKK